MHDFVFKVHFLIVFPDIETHGASISVIFRLPFKGGVFSLFAMAFHLLSFGLQQSFKGMPCQHVLRFVFVLPRNLKLLESVA